MAYCIRCGGEVLPGKPYCHHCGTSLLNPPAEIDPIAQPAQKGGGFRKILKWGGIGCGGLLGLFVLLIIIVAIADTTSDNENPNVTIVPDATNRVDANGWVTQPYLHRSPCANSHSHRSPCANSHSHRSPCANSHSHRSPDSSTYPNGTCRTLGRI